MNMVVMNLLFYMGCVVDFDLGCVFIVVVVCMLVLMG